MKEEIGEEKEIQLYTSKYSFNFRYHRSKLSIKHILVPFDDVKGHDEGENGRRATILDI